MIFFIIVIIVTQVIIALMLKFFIGDRCVLKKWSRLRRLCVGCYGYKSSFGAKNYRPGDDCTLRNVYSPVVSAWSHRSSISISISWYLTSSSYFWCTDTADNAYAADALMLLMCWFCWCADAAYAADALMLLLRWCGLSDFSLYCNQSHQSNHGIMCKCVTRYILLFNPATRLL